jgi:hypothetical protein
MIKIEPHQFLAHVRNPRTIDADTFEADLDLGHRITLNKVQVRLTGVDAPERRVSSANDVSKEELDLHVKLGKQVAGLVDGVIRRAFKVYVVSDKQLPKASYGARVEGDILVMERVSSTNAISVRKLLLSYGVAFETDDKRHQWSARDLLAVQGNLELLSRDAMGASFYAGCYL